MHLTEPALRSHDVSMHFDKVPTGLHMKEYTNSELVSILKEVGFRRFQAMLSYGKSVAVAFGADFTCRAFAHAENVLDAVLFKRRDRSRTDHSAIGDQADVLGAESIAQSLNNRVRASSHPKAKGRSAPSSTIPSTTCLSDGALLRRPAIRRAEARHPLGATRTQAEGRGNRAARNGQSRKLVWRFRRRMHRS
jgi:hypothetical protein